MMNRKRKYRYLILAFLALDLMLMGWLGYRLLDRKIPDQILVDHENSREVAGLLERPFVSFDDAITVSGKDSYTLHCRVFGVIPFKDVKVKHTTAKEVYVSGDAVGIYMQTKGVLIIDTGEILSESGETEEPARDIVKPGDYIVAFDQNRIQCKQDLMEDLAALDGDSVMLKVRRGKETIPLSLTPVKDKEGKYKGLISRRNLLGARGKNVILVDHNERGQAVDGIENANILELIDHHRLGTVETVGPVFFRNQPLGCTATIIFQMYREQGLEIDKTIAGLLCSAIISDTLLFRSPTCTPMDRAAAVSLAEMAGIKLDEFANQMFEAGSELKGKSDAEILYLDFKKFSAGKTNFGVGQINSLNAEELGKLKNRMLPFMEKAREDEGLDMIFFMLTNILTETTELLCVGQGAAQVVADAFHVGDANEELKQTATLPGVVSRKKQLIPALTVTLEQ